MIDARTPACTTCSTSTWARTRPSARTSSSANLKVEKDLVEDDEETTVAEETEA